MTIPALNEGTLVAPAQPKFTMPEPTEADYERKRRIKVAWDAYRGVFPDALKTDRGAENENVKTNRCAPIVDKGVSWLFGKDISLTPKQKSGKPLADARQQDLEDYLAACWGDADDMMTTLTMIAMNGAVAGHAFAKIVWDEEQMEHPRISVLDPEHIFVTTDPDDCNVPVAFTIEYKIPLAGANAWRVTTKRQVFLRVDPDGDDRLLGGQDKDDYWLIGNFKRTESNGQQQSEWQQIGEILEWRFPFPPIVDCMNLPNPNEFWGITDLPQQLIDLNKSINFVESNTAKIIKSHAHPWVFASGCDPTAIVNEPGVLQGLQSPDAKVWAVSASGDLASSMHFADVLRADMDEQSRVPAVALGRQESLPKGNISGVALELMFQPLVEKTELKRRLYGKLVRQASLWMLEVTGKIKPSEIEIDIEWPNLLPNDDQAMAQTAVLLSQIGYSQTTLIRNTGGDPDEEAENKREEQADQLEAFSKGQGLPAPEPAPAASDDQQAASTQAPAPTPPVNHPAAVAARTAAKAAGMAMKAAAPAKPKGAKR